MMPFFPFLSALLRKEARGAYFDGERLYFGEGVERPQRLYVAVSHSLLYFHELVLPSDLPPKKRISAAKLEAERIISLAKNLQNVSISCAPYWNGEKLLIAFQERGVLAKILSQVPSPLIFAGFIPAWVALLTWLKGSQKSIQEGFHFVAEPHKVEGFLFKGGRVAHILPSSPKLAEEFMISNNFPRFSYSPENSFQIFSQGAAWIERLPAEERVFFDGFPIYLRPQVPKKALLAWILPFLVGGSIMILEQFNQKQLQELAFLEAELKKTKKTLIQLEKKQQKYQSFKELQASLEKEFSRPPLLKALETLARLFPEDAWVRRLEFRAPDELRLWGQSQNTLALIKKLEKAPIFKEVKLLSSVTKSSRTGKEQFALLLRLRIS